MAAQDILWVLISALGLRLLWQGARLRSPEAVLGGAMLLLGAGAACVRYALDNTDVSLARTGIILVTLGTALLAWFTQLVFHPGHNAMRAVAALGVLLLAGGAYHQLFESGFGSGQARPSPVMAFTRALVLGWAAVESYRFRRMYVRRAAIGLADPVVTNRFLLFTIWTSALALMPVLSQVAVFLAGGSDAAVKGQMLAPARVLGLVCLVAIFLTFMPPAAYLRLVERRATAAKALAAP